MQGAWLQTSLQKMEEQEKRKLKKNKYRIFMWHSYIQKEMTQEIGRFVILWVNIMKSHGEAEWRAEGMWQC